MAKVQWKDGLIIFIRTLNNYKFAQSISALLTQFENSGMEIHLVTQSQPTGNDYISCENLIRHSLDYYEVNGYTSEEAFIKVIGDIPIKTIVFAGDIYGNTLSFFRSAQRLGRCIIYDTDRSPLCYIHAGQEKVTFSNLYMLRNADYVITHSQTDNRIIKGMGVPCCEYVPYYYPYSDEEVRAIEFSGGRIVYYTTYGGRNVSTPVEAFARLLEKYPDARMTVVPIGVKKSEAFDEFIDGIRNSSFSGRISIELNVLKPLRFLRDCDICINYSHLVTAPETVIESVSLGIPTINITDADFSADESCVISINAADEKAIEKSFEFFMDTDNCRKYSEKARENLTDARRADTAKLWFDCVCKAKELYENKLKTSVDKLNDFTSIIKVSSSLSEAVKCMKLRYATLAEVFGALIANGIGFDRALQAFKEADLIAGKDCKILNSRSGDLSCYEPSDIDSIIGAKVLVCDFVARLAVSGMSLDAISDIKGVCIDPEQAAYVLLSTYNIETSVKTLRMPFDGEESLGVADPVILSSLNAYRAFCLENIKYLNGKKYPLVSRSIRIMDWASRPFKTHSILGKIVLFPGRVFSVSKKMINKLGRKNLMKREVVEIASEDVRKIQLMVLKMMLEFERICQKHGLRYYLAGGTILGGIRHKGFIPWDDDMDITMPRPDYEKFLKIAQKELSPEFKLDKDCVPFCHNRIEYKDSAFDTKWRNGGIFLDILALDGSPDDEAERKIHEEKTRYWRSWMLDKALPLPALTSSRDVMMVFARRLISRFIPRSFLKWRWHSWAARYDCNETSSWVCLPASIYTYEQERFPKEYWGEPVMMEFEGHMMPTMSRWEDYLICHFGDYMKMPPLTLRKSHHFIYKYDLGKYHNIKTEDLEKELNTKRGE